ncbi:MAG: hypothetical protein ACTJLL_04295 [Anaplasma sp.]
MGFHKGVDYAVPTGTLVQVAGNGIVEGWDLKTADIANIIIDM